MQFTSVRLLKTILLFALCAVSLLCVPAAQCQDYVRTTIGTVSYTSPLYQQRYNSQGFNPPLVFDIGGTSTSENLFSVVPLTTANVTQFRMIPPAQATIDRKSTRLNSSHANISYAVFCLKKKSKLRPTYSTLPSS